MAIPFGSSSVSAEITRFYYDVDEEVRTACFSNKAFEDVDRDKADEYEEYLKQKGIDYTRTDL